MCLPGCCSQFVSWVEQKVPGFAERQHHSSEGVVFLIPLKGKGWIVPGCIPATTRNKRTANPTEQWKRKETSRGRQPTLPLEKEIHFNKADFCSWLLRIRYQPQAGFI